MERRAAIDRSGSEAADGRPFWAWKEYAIEATLLGLFMLSACSFTVLLYHPDSPLAAPAQNATVHRAWMGLAMGLTAVALIKSKWGQRSGAQMNPAVTLAFFRLGHMRRQDLVGYVVAQSIGSLLGVAVSRLLLGSRVADPAVLYAATLPGEWGAAAAFLAEAAISFLLLTVVLHSAARPRWARVTPYLAGTLVMLFITFEAPISGMSMNPARSLGSLAFAGGLTWIWLYLAAPLVGMLTAAELFCRFSDHRGDGCAKYDHDNDQPCIHCGKDFPLDEELAA